MIVLIIVQCIEIFISSLLVSSNAEASAWENFGVGSRASAMAGAYTALADDMTAAYYNPATLTECHPAKVTIGTLFSIPSIKVNGEGQELDKTFGVYAGGAIHIPFKKFLHDRIAFGIMAYFPGKFLHVIRYHFPYIDQPFIGLVDNYTERFIGNVALGFRLTRYLSLGAGINIFPFDAPNEVKGLVGVTNSFDIYSNLQLIDSYTVHAGVFFKPGELYDPLRRVRIGVSFRMEFDVQFSLSAPLNIGFPVNIDLRGRTLFTPNEVTLGIGYDPIDNLTASLDLTWAQWSHMPPPYLKISIKDLDVTIPGVKDLLLVPEDPKLDDIVIPMVGLEYRTQPGKSIGIAYRVGYAFRKSPVPDQRGRTNFLDNDRHIYSLGVGFKVGSVFSYQFKNPISLDLHMQYMYLPKRIHRKSEPISTDNPGFPQTESWGSVVAGGCSVTIQF